MPQMVTDKCPYCDNLQRARTSVVSDCTFCHGLGATVKPQFAGTEKGRSARQALANMRRMRLDVRDEQKAKAMLAEQKAHLVQS